MLIYLHFLYSKYYLADVQSYGAKVEALGRPNAHENGLQ